MIAPMLSLPAGPVDPLVILLPALLLAALCAALGFRILKKRLK